MTTMTAADPSPDRSLAMRTMRSAVATIPSTQYGKRAVIITATTWVMTSTMRRIAQGTELTP